MKCIECGEPSDGYAVIPGIGEAGEIRFFCDRDARKERVKLRYWDGRDLDVGGWREDPDLGAAFYTLVLAFEDLARMRHSDLREVLEWAEDREVALALPGAQGELQQRIYRALPVDRARAVRDLQDSQAPVGGETREAARMAIVDLVRRL